MHQVTNLRITDSEPLPSPLEMVTDIPRSDNQLGVIARSRAALHEIIHGRDRRLIGVVGPCSIHDLKACREYAEKFIALSRELEDRLFL